MRDMNGADVLSTIGQSHHRLLLLSELRDGSLTNRELRDRLDLPRTTVRNNLVRLSKHGWVEETSDRRYEITNLGRLIADRTTRFETEVRTAHRLTPFVERVPAAELERIDFGLLSDAEVVEPEANRPYAPDARLRDRAEASASVRAVCSVVVPVLFDHLCRRDLDGAGRVELVLGDDACDAFRTRYAADYRRLMQHEVADVQQYSGTIPYNIVLTDDHALLQAYDGESATSVLLETQCPNSLAWAATRLEAYQQQAVRLDE